MKNNIKKIIPSIFLVCSLLLLIPTTSFAVSASASANPSTVKKGDTLTVTIVFDGMNVGVVEGEYVYDKNILQYVSSDLGLGSSGKMALSGSEAKTITFKALQEGTTKVHFSASNIYSLDKDANGDTISFGHANANASIIVKEPDLDTPTTTQEVFKISLRGETFYLWKNLSTVHLPEEFKLVELDYKTKKVHGAERDGVNILYLTDQNGENGNFYLLDPSENLFPLINLNTSSAFGLVPPSSSVNLPKGYFETELELNQESIPAWQQNSVKHQDFYLLHLINKEGEKGFYLYDQEEETLQRYSGSTMTNSKSLLLVVGTLLLLSITLFALLIRAYIKIDRMYKH